MLLRERELKVQQIMKKLEIMLFVMSCYNLFILFAYSITVFIYLLYLIKYI